MMRLLGEVGFIEVRITQRFDCFRDTSKEDIAAEFTVRGINLSSFDDWARAVARREPTLDLATMFVPLFRVERMFLDEQVGEVESYRQRFERMAGAPVEHHLGVLSGAESGLVS